MLGLWLIALHMLGDYILQTHDLAMRKLDEWRIRAVHVALYTCPFAFFGIVVSDSPWQCLAFVALVGVPHFIVDSIRWAPGHPWCAKPILVDQTIHLLCLAAAGSLCYA